MQYATQWIDQNYMCLDLGLLLLPR